MKTLSFLLFFILSSFFLQSKELVLIPTSSTEQIKGLLADNTLVVHYYNDTFAIATSHYDDNSNFFILDANPWREGISYYIVYADESVDKSQYLKQIEARAEMMYAGHGFMVMSTNEGKYGQLPPAKNDGMVRIFNVRASIWEGKFDYSSSKTQPDALVQDLIAKVSGERITATVQHLQDFITRDAYKSQSIEAQEWIASAFEDLGLSVEKMSFYMPGGDNSGNVIATLRGSESPNEYVVVGGHYDSINRYGDAPGADDNASGTAAVIEIARLLSNVEFPRSILFCAFSGEEYGLYGSAAFAQRCRNEGMNILGYFNLDMIGYLKPGGSPKSTLIYPQTAKPLADFYRNICATYLPDFILEKGNLTGGDSDHTSFNNYGYMGIFPFEDIKYYSPYIHTNQDLIGPSYNSEPQAVVFTQASLAAVATVALGYKVSAGVAVQKLGVYPNPGSKYVNINLPAGTTGILSVFSPVGSIVSIEQVSSEHVIDVSAWPKGLYVLRVVNAESSFVGRLLVD